jgi:sporulation related protein
VNHMGEQILRFYWMMRLLHRSFFSLALVLMLFGPAGAQDATYTVQLKASPTRAEADEEVRQFRAKNIPAYIVKSDVPGKGVFYRVRAGVFPNRDDAKRFGADLQQRGVISEFFVTPYENPAGEAASAATPKSASQTKATAKPNQPAATPGNILGAAGATSRPIAKAQINPSPNSARNPAASSSTGALRSAPNPANNIDLSASVGEATASAPPSGFVRFRDPKIGYSFDYPDYWIGQPLSEKEASDQRMNGGATFSSEKDAAYLNVIWNEVDRANNPTDENDAIVDGILNGMSTSDGISKLEETARRVENRNGFIKTYIDLRAAVQIQGQSVPLDCLAKSVIIRASRGILLVAVFYTKDAPPNVASAADKIIASARAPK